jgi:GTP:adenosylcobinamide-phosphate guanylyltransferase
MIGLIPCGGQATRMQGLPKFLLPCSGGYLLQRMVDQMAVIPQVAILASTETLDLAQQYAPGGAAVQCVNRSSMADAIYVMETQVGDEIVVVGMPDTYWTDSGVYERLVAELADSKVIASVALWQIRSDQRGKLGQVLSDTGDILDIVDKDPDCPYQQVWGAIAWRPEFWPYIQPGDPHMGIALQRALDAGENLWGCDFDGAYYDCGTADEYFSMIRAVTAPEAVR